MCNICHITDFFRISHNDYHILLAKVKQPFIRKEDTDLESDNFIVCPNHNFN